MTMYPLPPTPIQALPSLEELLAQSRARTANALGQVAPETAPEDQGPLTGLLAPYSSPTGIAGALAYGTGGGGSLLGSLTASGGLPTPGGGYGAATGNVAPGGGPSVAPGGSAAAIPYSGPPDPTVEQWQSAYPTTGRIPQSELRGVPMNTGALVNRLEDAKPWQDVNMRLPNAERDFLMPEAAQSYRTMLRAAAAEGIPLVFGESYRSYPEQVAAAQSRGIYGQGGWAAVPGTSQHGLGLAVDLNLGASPEQRDWLVQHGPDYGWYFPMSDEPWHLQYEGGFEGWSPDFNPDWNPGRGGSPSPSSSSPAGPSPTRRRQRTEGQAMIERLLRERL